MNLKRVHSLLVSVLPLCPLMLVACTGTLDEGTGEESVGVAAQAATVAGRPMPNPVSTGLPHPASYTSSDGIVTDLVTGLGWQQGYSSGLTQADATAYCAGLTLGGHSDFRVPTRIELVSIVDDTRHGPATDPTYFPDTPDGYYWTSTPMVFFPNNAFKVSGGEGNTSYGGAGLNAVRCVRSSGATPAGQLVVAGEGVVLDTRTGLTWQREAAEETFTATEAASYCGDNGGQTLPGAGWRLPSMKELQTIVDDSRTFPAIDQAAFPGTPTDIAYWTSTIVPWKQVSNTWYVNFGIGQTNFSPTSTQYHARCVLDQGSACFIDGAVYPAGAGNPVNACQVCAPGASIIGWSSVENGTVCGAELACASGVCHPINTIDSFSFAPENLHRDKVGNGDHTMTGDSYMDGVFQAVVTGAIVNVAISTTDSSGACSQTQQNDTITDAAPIVAGMAACGQYTEGGQSYVLGVSLDSGATLVNGPTGGSLTPLAFGTYSLKLYGEGPKTALSSTYFGNGTSFWTLRVQFADGTVAVSPPVQAPHYTN